MLLSSMLFDETRENTFRGISIKKTVSERTRDTKEREYVCNKATSGQDFVPTGQRAGAINRDITADIHIINADVGKQMMRTN